ncbi:carbonic anhydrase 3-like [Alligator mississippiensis]|uniref:Carbonic anhydrase n=1 Tax=Alligator mississippiensis TaxID=8496 RepID=A0A151PHS8_ALLMI|nr:carbonic anhydrase 3-like [Alligator mississippiensis]
MCQLDWATARPDAFFLYCQFWNALLPEACQILSLDIFWTLRPFATAAFSGDLLELFNFIICRICYHPREKKTRIPGYQLGMAKPGFSISAGNSGYLKVLRGGPVQGAYRLRQLHFHWGSSDDHGSEHIIDGVKHAAELHMVHWNPKHGNFAGALKQRDGVAVVGIFLQVGNTPKPELKRILEDIDTVKTKGKEAPFHHFDPSILFPKSRDYWTYEGSFTTPPCEECITWILLREPIVVSPDQMAKLRSLSMNAENEPFCPLVDNWRPPQPLKGRVLRASFK